MTTAIPHVPVPPGAPRPDTWQAGPVSHSHCVDCQGCQRDRRVGEAMTTHTVPDDSADPEAAVLDVACPICGVQPGELCQDVVRGCIQPVPEPHLYRIQVAGEVA